MFACKTTILRSAPLASGFLKSASTFTLRGNGCSQVNVRNEISGRLAFSTTIPARSRPSGDLYNLTRNLLTLDSTRMKKVKQGSYDLSGLGSVFFSVPNAYDEAIRDRKNGPLRYKYSYPEDETSAKNLPFPPYTNGVLYYHKGELEIAGSIRFRICDDGGFKAGHDLMVPQSRRGDPPEPWSIPLYRIASAKTYRFLRSLLIQEKLVDPTLMQDLENLGIGNTIRTPLYTLEQPFVIDLANSYCQVAFVTRKGYTKSLRTNLFRDIGRGFSPYTGKVKVRHVRSPLSQHINNPCLLLQCLEFVTPVQQHQHTGYSYIKEPVVGKYIERKVDGKYQLLTLPLSLEVGTYGLLGSVLDL